MPATFNRTGKRNASFQQREVWILEDDVLVSQMVFRHLSLQGINCRVFNTVSSFLKEFSSDTSSEKLLLLDYYLDGVLAIDLVKQLRDQGQKFCFLVMTARGNQHLAVEIMKAGALDYIVKSENFVLHLPLSIEQAFERMEMARQLRESKEGLQLGFRKQKRLSAKILRQKIALEHEQAKAYKLLTNVLPAKIANELLTKGTAKAKYYSCVSVLFADVKNFSSLAASFSPIQLVQMLDDYFSDFDYIIGRLDLEKIKTIGDCYMCAGGIPQADPDNAFKVVLAGLQIQNMILEKAFRAKQNGHKYFDMRIGIHTGEVVAGVVGHRKFSYDVWGDAANTASWIVHAGEPNRVNVSRGTYEQIKDFFECLPRGIVAVKNNRQVEMFFVERLKPRYSADEQGIEPNDKFWEDIPDRESCL